MAWLPPAAPGDVERTLARVVGSWLAEWIMQPPALVVARRAGAEMRGFIWRGTAGARVGCSAETGLMIGQAICAVAGDIAHDADRVIFERIGAEVIQSWAVCIEGLLPGSPSARTEREELFALTTPSGWLIGMALGPAAVIALRRKAAGTGPKGAPAPRSAALGPLPVAVECRPGSASLTAGEVASLAPGDLVVLDRRLDDVLPLLVNGVQPASGRARIVRNRDGARVTLTERLSLDQKADSKL